MKRKILLSVLVFMTVCSTAFAAVAINGTYKGNPIIKVFVDGKEVKSAVPGQAIDGTTLLPVRAIAEALGADVKWDSKRFRADITTPKVPVQEGLSLAQLNKIGESVGVVYSYNGDQYIGSGSGFVVDNVFVTNWHVVEKATSFVVQFGRKQFTFAVNDALFKNENADLIGFRIEGITSLELNVAEPVNKDKVYALGFPAGKFSITEGQFTIIRDGLYHNTAKTDYGSSGGILIDRFGKVIGITSSGVEGNEFWNFAIPASVLQEELNKL